MAGVLDRTPRMRAFLLLAAGAGGLALAVPAPAHAQSTGNNCLVRQAADAAVQRQIALIDAAKVNPSSFFNGPNSCIANGLLSRFDLSNLIPDLSGFVTNIATDLVQSVVRQAERQVCKIIDDQLTGAIRSINEQMTSFQSSITGDLFRQLNGTITPITIPNITDIGKYNFSQNSDSIQNTAFGSALNLNQAQSTSPAAQSNVFSTIVIPPTSGTATSTGFGEIMQ